GDRRRFSGRNRRHEDRACRRSGAVRLHVFAVVVDEVAVVDQENQLAAGEESRRVQFVRHRRPLDPRGVHPDRLEGLRLLDELDGPLAQQRFGAVQQVDGRGWTLFQLGGEASKLHRPAVYSPLLAAATSYNEPGTMRQSHKTVFLERALLAGIADGEPVARGEEMEELARLAETAGAE